MSTRTIVRDPRCGFAGASEKAFAQESTRTLPNVARCKFLGLQYIEVNQIAENSVERAEDKSRFNLWNILFPDRDAETYRSLEGENMTPVVAYKSGDCYILADGGNHLSAARYMGQAYILAEVWELP
ncbi:MAG: hypothetical protein JXA21_20530 [Anaerolineae bacterium]|nr:hypothetical protein [Anaerolineae bacterium]